MYFLIKIFLGSCLEAIYYYFIQILREGKPGLFACLFIFCYSAKVHLGDDPAGH